ncbi:uncharacterized protein BDR25DRAFT_341958 [Lindgomyces ingoldianus]|uniref:Uncharacterized protein n=1 Tax=Lindgomyces ingoldianus TaxID=673940 RepID=A0ACB6R0P5_9PLEO|nr:uncharacterized protein BDR25DRAFT_341958 [Lindgomyces ingoldianus]KAF2472607.1 hypothetical protein BDR25DRAFT_341958 [Lindgomyces ingoldianus]
MSFPNRLLSPPTWRFLGLCLITTIFSLGNWCLIYPLSTAESLGVMPTNPSNPSSSEVSLISKAMVFLGARDLCIALSLFTFLYRGNQEAMGTVFTSAIVIYVLDIWVAAQGPRGWDKRVWGLCHGSRYIPTGRVSSRDAQCGHFTVPHRKRRRTTFRPRGKRGHTREDLPLAAIKQPPQVLKHSLRSYQGVGSVSTPDSGTQSGSRGNVVFGIHAGGLGSRKSGLAG